MIAALHLVLPSIVAIAATAPRHVRAVRRDSQAPRYPNDSVADIASLVGAREPQHCLVRWRADEMRGPRAISLALRFEMKLRHNGLIARSGELFLSNWRFLAKHFLRGGILGGGCAL
jgi:hypothetical protein